MPSSKLQIPKELQIPSSNVPVARWHWILELGVSLGFGVLEFGISSNFPFPVREGAQQRFMVYAQFRKEQAATDEPPVSQSTRRSGDRLTIKTKDRRTILLFPGGGRGVLSFDLFPDGTVAYSNGTAIFLVDPAGKSRRLVTESMIEQVVALEEAARPPGETGAAGAAG
jgi:hypothetical protein